MQSLWNIESTIAAANLSDVGIITPQDSSKVTTIRVSFQLHSEEDAILCLYLDGRKKTMENVFEEDGKYLWRILIEEHTFLVGEPASELL